MNVGIGNEAAKFQFWEYLNRIFFALYVCLQFELASSSLSVSLKLLNSFNVPTFELTNAFLRAHL
jgi:hypothetical protein